MKPWPKFRPQALTNSRNYCHIYTTIITYLNTKWQILIIFRYSLQRNFVKREQNWPPITSVKWYKFTTPCFQETSEFYPEMATISTHFSALPKIFRNTDSYSHSLTLQRRPPYPAWTCAEVHSNRSPVKIFIGTTVSLFRMLSWSTQLSVSTLVYVLVSRSPVPFRAK